MMPGRAGGGVFVASLCLALCVCDSFRADTFIGPGWEDKQVSFQFNPGFTGNDAGALERQVEVILCAAKAWTDQTRADFRFVFEGTTEVVGVDLNDGVNNISLVDAGEQNEALAATFVLPDLDQTTFVAFDVVFFDKLGPTTLRWTTANDPELGTVDIMGIATHELGHAAGLGHLDDSEATMFFSAQGRGLSHRSLNDLDRECIESFYGLRTVEMPTVDVLSATPASGSIFGGNEVVIAGGNFTFTEETTLLFGDVPLLDIEWTVESCDRLRVLRTPEHSPGAVDITVINAVGEGTGAGLYEFRDDTGPYIRGDANGDGDVDIADAQTVLGVLFRGDPEKLDCEKSADFNDSAKLDIADPIATLRFLFLGADDPPQPFSACGRDPTTDTLTCGASPVCE